MSLLTNILAIFTKCYEESDTQYLIIFKFSKEEYEYVLL